MKPGLLRFFITVTVMLPTMIEIIDISIVNVSLDHIRGSLSAGIDESTWTITSYLVSNAVIIPMSGWLSRLFGRKRYLIYSITLFTFSSFFCGLAWNLPSLIVFRVLQGIGGGGLQPVSQSILLETYPPEQHGKAMGIFGIGVMFGPIMGPIMGGLISDNWSWRWIFLINIPFGILAIILAAYFIKDPPYMKRTKMRIDYIGLALLVLTVGTLQIVLDKGEQSNWFDSTYIIAGVAISLVALCAFLIVEYYSDRPIINLKSFRNVSFSTGNIMMFFTFMCYFSSIVLLPIYLQTILGYTSTLAGFVLGPGGVATLVTMPLVGRFLHKTNPKNFIVAGLVLNTLGALELSRLNLTTDFATVNFLRIILGAGVGMIFVPLTTMTLSTVPKEEMGNATGIYNFLRNCGGSFGVAIVTTVFARRAQFHHARLGEHLTPYDAALRHSLGGVSLPLPDSGVGPYGFDMSTLALLDRQLDVQSMMLSFNDAFYVSFVLMLFVFPLVLLLKRQKHGAPGPAMAHE